MEHLSPQFLPSIASELTAETIVTRDVDVAADFLQKKKCIVSKKANSCGGKGVTKIVLRGDGSIFSDNLVTGELEFQSSEECFQEIFRHDPNLFQLVPFLANSWRGDKRVLVVGGEIFGAYLRKGEDGSWIHNVSSGGRYEAATISEQERFAIRITSEKYNQMGILTLGYDFLADENDIWLVSEINAGNIAGYLLLEELTGRPIYDKLKRQVWQFAQDA